MPEHVHMAARVETDSLYELIQAAEILWLGGTSGK
jgi:hypothetical protein